MISDLVLVHPVSTSNGGELVDTYPGQPDHPQTGHFQLVTRLPRLDNEAGQHAAVSFFPRRAPGCYPTGWLVDLVGRKNPLRCLPDRFRPNSGLLRRQQGVVRERWPILKSPCHQAFCASVHLRWITAWGRCVCSRCVSCDSSDRLDAGLTRTYSLLFSSPNEPKRAPGSAEANEDHGQKSSTGLLLTTVSD